MLAPFRSRGVKPYVLGIVGVVIATALRIRYEPYLGEHLSFSFHYLAVSIAAWAGGLLPALVATLLSALLGNFYFTDPNALGGTTLNEELLSLSFFIVVSVIIGILSEISLQALARAKRAEQEKDNFLAVLAHEMRSPISVIYYANALNRVSGSDHSTDQLNVIDRQVVNLNVMIEDLLDVSRIARGMISLDRKKVDASEIVSGGVERAKPMIQSHTHALKVTTSPEPMPLMVDPARMEQVVANLLNNAAKYTPDGGKIEVLVQPVGDSAVFSVRDNGIGIPAEAMPRLFDLFVQAESSQERAGGGLGIGLAIVRKIVEMHGGSVRASSPGPNRGSEFVVTVPLYQPMQRPNIVAEPRSHVPR